VLQTSGGGADFEKQAFINWEESAKKKEKFQSIGQLREMMRCTITSLPKQRGKSPSFSIGEKKPCLGEKIGGGSTTSESGNNL